MNASILLEEAGPNTELGWLLYLFLGFFLLMVVVGWWVSRRNGTVVEVPQEMHVLHHETSAEPFAWELGWWFPQLALLFILLRRLGLDPAGYCVAEPP